METIEVTSYSKKGHGIVKIASRSVEVPKTAVGDRITLELPRRKRVKRLIRFELEEPSIDRIEPKCVHFSLCGGCTWQHLSYEKQLELKKERILKLFFPLISDDTQIFPIIGSKTTWNYRNKMEFTFTQRDSTPALGLMPITGRRGAVALRECHLIPPWMDRVRNAVFEWWKKSDLRAYDSKGDVGSLRTLTLRYSHSTGESMAILTVSAREQFALKKAHLQGFIQAVQEQSEISSSIFLRLQQIQKGRPTQFYSIHVGGKDHILERVCLERKEPKNEPRKEPLVFKISPETFFQPNTALLPALLKAISALIPKKGPKTLLDLFCGSGVIGIALSDHFDEVIGVEENREALFDCSWNLEANQIENYSSFCGDVKAMIKEWVEEKRFANPPFVLVDPPRAGLEKKGVEYLHMLAPPYILYVSCSAESQALDVKELIERGYEIKAIQSIDQFPQTPHVENLVLLKAGK